MTAGTRPETIIGMVMIGTPGRFSTVMTAGGAAVFVLAYGWFAVTGDGGVSASADAGAAEASPWAAALPALAAMLVARLLPRGTIPPEPLAGLPRSRLVRETGVLLAAALAFTLVTLGRAGELWYPLAKVVFLLVVPLVALRLLRRGEPAARAVPAPVVWLAPLLAAAVWFLPAKVGPLATPLTQELPDPVTLAVSSLVVFLTASMLEEFFYRGWFQSRMEALYGRWPAIFASALLFAAMHANRLGGGAGWVASPVVFQGTFGLMLGYLWSRYRNIWVIVAIHGLSNLVYVDLLLQGR
ncbi:hypothetical protein Pta02_77240 [Planobispora takensis]|uniref:CAAX prenyl protease 2/Lysostaphin resistance protein A-like domain-containing protein n=2 Tax=Planobispora takensis TaxID=1367882 RepID=A0A8J3T788_9ACTN|nr:CPBP family intramembrane glutamic endopeptidase [Planobispora takensis]GII05716.1 hypothetical protein Pta02_77240 [Planobispora takensis]